jgi:methylenetetrahydrofolate dehydrogenase (NADP+)/methenyltetrahydrofolate cyclohydrolase
MTASLIDGKAMAQALRAQVAAGVAEFSALHGSVPTLAVVLVGDDPASQVYVGSKVKQTVEAGMHSRMFPLPATATQTQVLALVNELNADPEVDGILVQLPLPAHIDADVVIAALDPAKDVDGLTAVNAGLLASGRPGLVPCTPQGALLLIKSVRDNLSGLDAVVVGRSNLFGKPMAQLLLQEDATVTVAHSRTRDLASHCRRADLLIAAVGRAELIRGDWIKPGAIVIDVGINRLPASGQGKGRLLGDVAFAEACDIASAITPVPGGVGPMTVACLLANTLKAARRRRG